MGQAKQRGTYEQRRALAVALIEENTKAAAIEVKKLQGESEPRIMMIEGGHSSRMVMAMAVALADSHAPIAVCSPVPNHRRTRKNNSL